MVYLSTDDGAQYDGKVMGIEQIHVAYWSGYHFCLEEGLCRR